MFEQRSIKHVLDKLNNEYYLPAIQRDFVWDEKQIINLFDSILKDYPIGTFLFWKVTEVNAGLYEYYRFIQNYNNKEKYNDNKVKGIKTKQNIISILDGQQRLTSLLIGLNGSYAKEKTQYLYINLSKMNESEEIDDIQTKYLLSFKTDEDVLKDKSNKWFKVSDVLNMSAGDMTVYAIENRLERLGIDILSELHEVIHNKLIINYYLIEENDIDKVLNIFVRINKGGTHLSYSDLLLSIATANWNNISARDAINQLIDEISIIEGEFNITKDFILKTALLLIDKNTKFISSNLKTENMQLMESNWDKIRIAIRQTFVFLSENNFDNKSLPSINVASFLAYFFFNREIENDNEKQEILLFIYSSLLKRIYSSSLDGVLEQGRKYLKTLDIGIMFSSKKMLDTITLKNTTFIEEEIEAYTDIKVSQKSFMLLMTIVFNSKNLSGLEELVTRERAQTYNGEYTGYLRTIANYRFHNIPDTFIIQKDINSLDDTDIDLELKERELKIIFKLKKLLLH